MQNVSDLDSHISEIRKAVNNRKAELLRPEATSKAQYIAIVAKEWFKSLIKWLTNKTNPFPGQINNRILFSEGKFDVSKQFNIDFVILKIDVYDFLVEQFRGGPKITRPYVLHPGSGKPTVILDPVVFECQAEEKVYKKVVSPDWKLVHIKKALCNSLGLLYKKCRFQHNGDTIDESISVVNAEPPISLFIPLDAYIEQKEKPRYPIMKDIETHTFQLSDNYNYINVVIQVLFHLPSILEFLVSDDFHINEKPSSYYDLTMALRKVALDFSAPGQSAISPLPLINALSKHQMLPLDFDQKDSLEICCTILNALSAVTSRKNSSGVVESQIHNRFKCTLHAIYECIHCNHQADIDESSYYLSLPLPPSVKTAAFEDCIAQFCATEKLNIGEKWNCPTCHKYSQAYRTYTIKKVPEILITQFRRFGNMPPLIGNITTEISISEELNTLSFASNGCTYQLQAIIYHDGFLDEGKFSCSTYDEHFKTWLYYYDDKVYEIESCFVDQHREATYLLFYKRVDN